MIELDVRKTLRDITVEMRHAFPRGVTVLAGPSGSGKTTVLRMIAGLTRPDAGSVRLDGRVLDDGATHVAPFGRAVGYVFQEYALFPHLDVLQNVAFGLEARGVAHAARTDAARAQLERLGIARLAASRPRTLSGGERQRVALARALAVRPQALLLDEPFAALDSVTRGRVRDELRATLATLDVPVVLVTHDDGDAAAFAAPVVRLARGRVVAE